MTSNSSAAPSTPLLDYSSSGGAAVQLKDELYYAAGHDEEESIKKRTWIESKKLWHIVGPAIFSRIASFSMFIITQAFAGHLGDLDLAALSIATNVIFGFDFGLLVRLYIYIYISSFLLILSPFLFFMFYILCRQSF